MTKTELHDADNVVRYARFTDFLDLESGTLNCSAFQLKPNELGLSVNWLEYFRGCDKSGQLEKIRSLIQIGLGPNGRFAELNAESTLEYVVDRLPDLRFVHSPSPPKGPYAADPSHSEVMGLPPNGSPESELIGDLIVQCVNELHPTISPPA